MHLTSKQKAIYALCVVAFSYALLSVVVRLMSAGFGPFTQVYVRIGLGCLLTVLIFYNKIRFTRFTAISHRDWFFLLLMGTIGYGISVDFVTLGTLHTKLLDVAVISSTTPFFIFLFSVLFLRKPFRGFLFLFVLMAFYGVCLLATKSFIPTINLFGIGDFYILLFAIGLAFYILGRKMLSSFLNNYEIAFLVMGIAFICSFIIALFAKEQLTLAAFVNPLALFGLLLGGVLNLVATTLETFGFKHINAVAGSQIMLLENVFAPLFGFFFYHELLLLVEYIGAGLVILGVWAYITFGED